MDVVMRLIVHGTAALLILLSSSASATRLPNYCGTTQWQPFINEAATRFALSSQWLDAVIRAESAGCESTDGHPTTSAAGAMGLMQLLPPTWYRFRRRLNLGTDAYDPHDNILAGVAYLRELYDRYGWPGASAAYHAGPARYDEYLRAGRPLPQATLNYLSRIDRSLARMNADVPPPSTANATPPSTDRELFVARKPPAVTPDAHSDHTQTDVLFVTLRHSKRPAEPKAKEASDVQQK